MLLMSRTMSEVFDIFKGIVRGIKEIIEMRRIFNIANKKLPKFKTFEDMISYIDDKKNKATFSMIQNKMNRVIEPTLEENAFYMHYRRALDIRNEANKNDSKQKDSLVNDQYKKGHQIVMKRFPRGDCIYNSDGLSYIGIYQNGEWLKIECNLLRYKDKTNEGK